MSKDDIRAFCIGCLPLICLTIMFVKRIINDIKRLFEDIKED